MFYQLEVHEQNLMKKLIQKLTISLILISLLTTQVYAEEQAYDGTITNIDPDSDYPVKITYRYSKRRNMTRQAVLCKDLTLSDVSVGMSVKWVSYQWQYAMIVGPIPQSSSESIKNIQSITINVEGSKGETLAFTLDSGEWHLEDQKLVIDSRQDVSSLLSKPEHEKTVMFVTHLALDSRAMIDKYLDESEFNIWEYNYVMTDFPIWGDYFNYRMPDTEINNKLLEFKDLGFKNLLYVDPTECDRTISDRWSDSVIESGDWWSLMTLDPNKSWYQFIKSGMLDMTEKYPYMAGFAIDRLDRCKNEQEEIWAAQLLDEVQAESKIPVKYVMNTLQPWMTDLASRAVFIGSDRIDATEPKLSLTINDYETLASYTETKKFYINPYMGRTRVQLVGDFKEILKKHDFIFVDDYYADLLKELFPLE